MMMTRDLIQKRRRNMDEKIKNELRTNVRHVNFKSKQIKWNQTRIFHKKKHHEFNMTPT